MGCLSCSVLNTTLPLMPRFARESLLICISSSSWLTQRIMKMKSWQHVCLSSFWSVLSSCTKGFSEIRSNRFSFLFFFVVSRLGLADRDLLFGGHTFIYSHVVLHTCCRLIADFIERGATQHALCFLHLCVGLTGPRCLYVKAFSLTNIQTLNKL